MATKNRAERRHPKKLDVRQVIQDVATISKLKRAIEDGWKFNNGDKVRLDLDAIKKHPGYDKKVPAYREFCERNADRVFYSGVQRRNAPECGLPCRG